MYHDASRDYSNVVKQITGPSVDNIAIVSAASQYKYVPVSFLCKSFSTQRGNPRHACNRGLHL